MTLHALATALESRGVVLGLNLAVDAPVGAITPELKQALVEHKAALLMSLAREAQWNALKDLRWAEPGTPESDAEYERAERFAIQHEAD